MKSWSFGGGPESLSYHVFDALRIFVNRSLVRYLLKHGIHQSGKRVLEAGAGPAYASSLLGSSDKVSLAAAVDLDLEALRQGKERDARLAAVVGDIRRLPFQDGSFDMVWNSSTVEHLEHPAAAVSEMQRVASKDGYVFVGVPYRHGPLGFQPWIAESPAGIWIGRVFETAQLRALLECGGYRVVKTRMYFFYFFIGMLARRG